MFGIAEQMDVFPCFFYFPVMSLLPHAPYRSSSGKAQKFIMQKKTNKK